MKSTDSFFQIWRVNMGDRTLRRENVPVGWETLGGRGLSARILMDEVAPKCDPLRPENKLIFAPGLLVGHMLSSCDRISIGAKSPLTHGIKEANAGGRTGYQLSRLGIKALIIEGGNDTRALEEADRLVLVLNSEGARFEEAKDLTGSKNLSGLMGRATLPMQRGGPSLDSPGGWGRRQIV